MEGASLPGLEGKINDQFPNVVWVSQEVVLAYWVVIMSRNTPGTAASCLFREVLVLN
jgi:hypothetical protein